MLRNCMFLNIRGQEPWLPETLFRSEHVLGQILFVSVSVSMFSVLFSVIHICTCHSKGEKYEYFPVCGAFRCFSGDYFFVLFFHSFPLSVQLWVFFCGILCWYLSKKSLIFWCNKMWSKIPTKDLKIAIKLISNMLQNEMKIIFETL